MKTPDIKPSQRRQSAPAADWKNHPLVIAAVSVAGTATLFSGVIMPLSNSLLSAKVERMTELSANAAATAAELDRTKQQLVGLRVELLQAQMDKPFADGSIYPIGADAVVLGTQAKEVLARLPNSKFDENNSFISVHFPDSAVFSGAAYYFDDKQAVSSILFHFKGADAVSAEMIKKVLLRRFGEPTHSKKNNVLWKTGASEWVAIEEIVSGLGSSYYVHSGQAVLLRAKWGDSIKGLK